MATIRPKKTDIKGVLPDGTEEGAAAGDWKIQWDLHEKDFFVVCMLKVAADMEKKRPDLTTELKQIQDAIAFFDTVTSVEFTPLRGKAKQFKYTVKGMQTATKEEGERRARELIETPIIKDIILTAIIEPKRINRRKQITERPKQYKQSRTSLREVAHNVGRDTEQKSLYGQPLEEAMKTYEEEVMNARDGLPYKEKMSRKVGILQLLMIQEYNNAKHDKDGFMIIENLGALADTLETDLKELKYYLLYLAGYQYPSVELVKDTNEIEFSTAKMFDIRFRYDREHPKIKAFGIEAMRRIETEVISMLMDIPVQRMLVKPNPKYIKDLSGKRLGYVKVTDGFVAFCLGLSDYAFKLLNYMAANRPDYKISEDKLFEKLGLQKQVKQQRPARIRKKLAEAFAELHEKGHLKDYSVPTDGAGLYCWTYTELYVLHETARKPKGLKPGAEYVDFDDTSIPAERRQRAYEEWLKDAKDVEPGKARQMARAKFRNV